MEGVGIADGRPLWISLINDASGQIIRRDESNTTISGNTPHEHTYRFAGKQMGFVGNNGTMETSYVASIADRTTQGGTGPFKNGATDAIPVADFYRRVR